MEVGGWDSVPNWDVHGGAGESPHAWIIVKAGTAASREANKMMWYRQWESVLREEGGIIDSQRALRFTGHKMEVSRTHCKSGQPISSLPPSFDPEDVSQPNVTMQPWRARPVVGQS